jgi:hypothetical protein
MVHVLVAKPDEERLPVIFNVDAVVGATPAANNPDDVVLVKAFLKMMADVPLDTGSELVTACQAIVVNGSSDSALVTAIRAFQNEVKRRTGNATVIVDGRVSPAKESYRYAAGTPWSIVQLNVQMKAVARFGPVWPCVHLASNCPAALAPVAKKAIFGVDV